MVNHLGTFGSFDETAAEFTGIQPFEVDFTGEALDHVERNTFCYTVVIECHAMQYMFRRNDNSAQRERYFHIGATLVQIVTPQRILILKRLAKLFLVYAWTYETQMARQGEVYRTTVSGDAGGVLVVHANRRCRPQFAFHCLDKTSLINRASVLETQAGRLIRVLLLELFKRLFVA